ncbi:chorismate mutase [Lichtheimia corymbifera JMRC:FSU:9682]|uniref:Chorismate mutase n=1 Tax=Lichtheimia corymbifera JMRC:FSU:9682 TaxID=1263082 RepID=A0A068RFU9_9FUNG|nr:chorismate mutase [Lichtheimia corymbifera JMRC:FSU:9682]
MNTIDNTHSNDKIRRFILRLEDTLICALIERAQFAHNHSIYIPGALDFNNMTGKRSFLEYFLWETEKMHAKARRYVNPGEYYPFTSPLPAPTVKLPPSLFEYPSFLWPNEVNINDTIMDIYTESIVPTICTQADGDDDNDDGQYANSAMRDIECLEALSRRIHYAKFVAEMRFRGDSETFARLARAYDRQAIADRVTDRSMEKKMLQRLGRKALVYGQTLLEETEMRNRLPAAQQVVQVYERWVIPLSRKVEVDYLITRGLAYCTE